MGLANPWDKQVAPIAKGYRCQSPCARRRTIDMAGLHWWRAKKAEISTRNLISVCRDPLASLRQLPLIRSCASLLVRVHSPRMVGMGAVDAAIPKRVAQPQQRLHLHPGLFGHHHFDSEAPMVPSPTSTMPCSWCGALTREGWTLETTLIKWLLSRTAHCLLTLGGTIIPILFWLSNTSRQFRGSFWLDENSCGCPCSSCFCNPQTSRFVQRRQNRSIQVT